MLNLSVVLEDSARTLPDREAVVCGPARLTYAQVDALARQVAAMLVARGVAPGDKVAVASPNLPLLPSVMFGVLKAGAVLVPLNPLLVRRELAFALADSDAKVLIAFSGTDLVRTGEESIAAVAQTSTVEHLLIMTPDPAAPSPFEGFQTLGQALAGVAPVFETVATAADDTAVILYTSGTTGRPKGAELSHSNLVHNALAGERLFDVGEHDVHLVSLPLFHVYAISSHLTSGFLAAATLVLQPRFDPTEALALMQREGVTLYCGVPTMYWALVQHPVDDEALTAIRSTLRFVASGGSALAPELLKAFEAKFGVKVFEGYGMSETSPTTIANSPYREVRPGMIGRPIWGIEAKVVDSEWNQVPDGEPGELVVRGHAVMKGYYKRPDATEAVLRNGWLRTGDIARRDTDGYFAIVDRAKEMVIRNGLNVYPREVEDVLMTHPDVSLVAVLGVPDDAHGEEIKAYVVRTPGAMVTEDELIAWSKSELAAYKYPRHVEFRDALPLTATGKIRKLDLKTSDQAHQPVPASTP